MCCQWPRHPTYTEHATRLQNTCGPWRTSAPKYSKWTCSSKWTSWNGCTWSWRLTSKSKSTTTSPPTRNWSPSTRCPNSSSSSLSPSRCWVVTSRPPTWTRKWTRIRKRTPRRLTRTQPWKPKLHVMAGGRMNSPSSPLTSTNSCCWTWTAKSWRI